MKFMILIFFTSLLFAVRQVPRTQNSNVDRKSSNEVQVVQKDVSKQNKERDERVEPRDTFEDSNKNSINDKREDDFQKIKQLKTKHKDLFKNKTDEKIEKTKRPPPKKNKTTKKRSK